MRYHYTLTFGIVLLISFAISSTVQAQDARFAQFYTAPLQLNPALSGVFEGKLRVAVNYRQLYSSILSDNPFRTIAASLEYKDRINRRDFYTLNISALRDEVGIAQFNRTKGHLGASILKQLSGGRRSADQYLIAGAQLGFGQRGYDWRNLWFSPQFDEASGVINLDTPNNESFENGNTGIYLDFNVGVLWYAVFDDNQSLYFGGAFHHINSPNISFLDNVNEKLNRRWVLHSGGELPFTDNLSILPAIAVMGQGNSMSTTAGANFRFTNREWREVAIRAGMWGHLSNHFDKSFGFDAVIFTAILEMEKLQIGLSYDVTASQLSAANNSRGAFEVSLIFTQPEKSRYRVSCPKL